MNGALGSLEQCEYRDWFFFLNQTINTCVQIGLYCCNDMLFVLNEHSNVWLIRWKNKRKRKKVLQSNT